MPDRRIPRRRLAAYARNLVILAVFSLDDDLRSHHDPVRATAVRPSLERVVVAAHGVGLVGDVAVGLVPGVADKRLQGDAGPVDGVLGAAAGSGAGVLVSSRHLHEAVQDGEFELELGAVDKGLVGRLVLVLVGVFEAEDGDVEEDDEGVDKDEMVHETTAGFAVAHALLESQELGGFKDVNTGDDDLLDEEDGDLDLFHDGIWLDPDLGIAREGPKEHGNN